MSTRARLIVAATVALISLVGIAVLAIVVSHGDGRAAAPFGVSEHSAAVPFTGYRAARVDIDGRCRPVVVADTATLQEQGLRGREDLGGYAGMVFVTSHDTDTAFTMSGVAAPLEVSWYSANGKRLGGAHMAACPDRDEAHCPEYRSPSPYRVALETPGGSRYGGDLAPCGGGSGA